MSGLAAAYRQAERRTIPIEVSLEITHRCNLRCAHCYIPDLEAPDGLSTDRLHALLEELAEAGTLVLALSGGEPLLRREWLDLAIHARALDFDLHLFTNGTRIGEREAVALGRLGVTAQVSFHTRDEAAFDCFTARAGTYRRVCAGLERLRAHGVRTVLKVPLLPVSLGGLGAIEEWADELGAEVSSSPIVAAKQNGDPAPLSLRLPWSELLLAIGPPVLGCGPGEEAAAEDPLCAAATRYACITAAGDLLACNILPGSDMNLRHRPFREAWEGSAWLRKVRSLRRRDLPVCGPCREFSVCGRCPAQALVEDGDLAGPSRHACDRATAARALAGGRSGAA